MTYADADAMRMALEQRLRNEAAANGVALLRLRKRVVFERFLARLAVSPAEWVLKGAFALELRLGLQTRMTKDIDLARALPGQITDSCGRPCAGPAVPSAAWLASPTSPSKRSTSTSARTLHSGRTPSTSRR
jgi:Nucleotidyl transferase AbiEii toxin, Type IV TA system